MHVLITGGAGFIGSQLTDALLKRGDCVTVLDNFDDYYSPASKRDNLLLAREYGTFHLIEGDIRDAACVAAAFDLDPPDAVVHLAALAGVRLSLDQPLKFNDVNINGTLVMLEAARKHSAPRFILASTSSAYGHSPVIPFREDDPLLHVVSPYGITKIACEKYAYVYHQVHGMSIVALRFFTAHGPRQRPDMAIHRFTRAILAGEEVTLFGDGSTSRDYTYIDDIIHGVLAALDRDIGFDIINLGNCTATKLIDLVQMIEQACGAKAKIRYLPEQAGDPPHTCADITRAREVLGFEPRTSVPAGIEAFVDWYRGSGLA